jgi:hypothetical protein
MFSGSQSNTTVKIEYADSSIKPKLFEEVSQWEMRGFDLVMKINGVEVVEHLGSHVYSVSVSEPD